MNLSTKHQSVLLQESIDMLDIWSGDIVIDATFGAGGHSAAIAARLGPEGTLVGLDVDSSAIEAGRAALHGAAGAVHLKVANFRNLAAVLDELGIRAADKYLFDLGYSSLQLERSGRGLSFQRDEPLLMTLSDQISNETLTAERIVNNWSAEQIETIIRSYGEERFAGRIASAIEKTRAVAPIVTTLQLANIIEEAVPAWYRRRRIHPATKTFQALRITVNDELDALKEGLREARARLAAGGRIAVISFHSMEDRIVKRTFVKWHGEGLGAPLARKPITPSQEEVLENPRSRSAKLRIFEKYVITNGIK